MNNALQEYHRKRKAGEIPPPIRRNPTQRSQDNPSSLRKAINALCYECVGADSDSNWMARIKFCQILNCSLHKVRPYSKGITNKECLAWKEN